MTSTQKVLALLLALIALTLAGGFYARQVRIQNQAEAVAQELKAQLQAKVNEVNAERAKAAKADEQAKVQAEALQIEHLKSEAYRKKLAQVAGPPPVELPAEPSDDPIILRDQVIAQQQVELVEAAKTIDALTLSRDTWKLTAEKTKEALDLSERRARSEEIAKNAAKRVGFMREVRGMGKGGAIVFLAHLVGVF